MRPPWDCRIQRSRWTPKVHVRCLRRLVDMRKEEGPRIQTKMKQGGPLKQRTDAEKKAKREARAAVTGNPVSAPAKKKPIKKVSKSGAATMLLDAQDRANLRKTTVACERCGRSYGVNLELHHVRTKGACPEPEFRHDPRNHVLLCVETCHVPWAHAKPKEFRTWFWKHRPEDAEAIKLPMV